MTLEEFLKKITEEDIDFTEFSKDIYIKYLEELMMKTIDCLSKSNDMLGDLSQTNEDLSKKLNLAQLEIFLLRYKLYRISGEEYD